MDVEKIVLEPCPFCGGIPTLKEYEDIIVIVCPPGSTCEGSGLSVVTTPENLTRAITRWNNRIGR